MKKLLAACAILILYISCNSDKNNARETAEAITKTVEQTRPGAVATSDAGWTLKAVIDGKAWSASAMMPPADIGRIIGYYKDEYMGLPFGKEHMKKGATYTLGDEESAEYFAPGSQEQWGTGMGELLVTYADEAKIEGSFHFTQKSKTSGRELKVTDGFFRIPLEK